MPLLSDENIVLEMICSVNSVIADSMSITVFGARPFLTSS